MAANKTDIHLTAHLDKDNIPERLEWRASNTPTPSKQTSKAFLVSLWDAEEKQAWRIDLWTKDMPVNEMGQFFVQTLLTMGDTYQRATGNSDLNARLKQFAQEFAEEAARTQRG